jgi:hypothetical protein
MVESLYVDFKAGQALEIVPKPGFRCVFQGTEIARPLTCLANDSQLTIGDPEGARGCHAQWAFVAQVGSVDELLWAV